MLGPACWAATPTVTVAVAVTTLDSRHALQPPDAFCNHSRSSWSAGALLKKLLES